MGLDTVELVMEMEDEFGISIPDADAEKLGTVGNIYDYLRDRLSALRGERCVTQAIFYRLRSAMVTQFGLRRRNIRPAARLDQLLHPEQWQQHWQYFCNHLGLELPLLLRHSRRYATDGWAIAFIISAAIVPSFFLQSVSAGVPAASTSTAAT